MSAKASLYCSFCGKSSNEVKKLIVGPAVFICDECVDLCSEIVHNNRFVELGEMYERD